MSRSIDDRLIHADASAESVALLRVWVFAILAVFVLRDPLALGAELPRELFTPIGLLWWLPGRVTDLVLTPGGLLGLKLATLAACLAAAAGLACRASVPAAAALVVLWQTVFRGFMGYSNHAQITLVLAAIVLAFSPCDHALTVWPRRPRQASGGAYQFPLVVILAIVCSTYLFIGAYRLGHGGVALFQSRSLDEWILWWNLREPDPAATFGVWWISHPVTSFLGRAGFPLLTLLEVSAPLCLISGSFRRFFIPAMLLAHTGILLLMHISFVEQALCYLVFIDSRHWSPVRRRGGEPGIVWFDGVCVLCNGFVDFLLRRDPDRRWRFAPLQGSTAAGRFGPVSGDPRTVLYEEDGMIVDRSTAALRALGRLGGAWPLLSFLGLIPRPLRDRVYEWVARHRYRWFGRRETCRLPTPGERAVFLP